MGRAGKARRRGGLCAREEEQRRQRAPAQLNRVRSVVTLEVISVVVTNAKVHQAYQAVDSGQLRFLGSTGYGRAQEPHGCASESPARGCAAGCAGRKKGGKKGV